MQRALAVKCLTIAFYGIMAGTLHAAYARGWVITDNSCLYIIKLNLKSVRRHLTMNSFSLISNTRGEVNLK